nr:substrate-binding domain-containing protein [Angustibacter aerolatus]
MLALPMAACSSSKPEAAGGGSGSASSAAGPAPIASATTVTAPEKAKKNYNIQFLQGVAGDQFYITMQCGAQDEASTLGVTVKTQGAQKFDPTLQKPILDSIVAGKPDALLVAPTDVSAMQQPLQRAAAAGIKVVLVDTTVNDPSFAVSGIASDNEGGGKAAFDAIKKPNPGGGKVMIVGVDPGISTTDARAKGFEEAVKADSKFQYVGVQYSHNDPATASQARRCAGAEGPRPGRHLRGQPVRRRGLGHRRQAGRQERSGEDRRLRRRPEPDRGPQGGHRAGPGGAAARPDRRLRRRPGGRRARRRSDHHQGADRLHRHHEGQPGRRGRAGRLQVLLLTRGD